MWLPVVSHVDTCPIKNNKPSNPSFLTSIHVSCPVLLFSFSPSHYWSPSLHVSCPGFFHFFFSHSHSVHSFSPLGLLSQLSVCLAFAFIFVVARSFFVFLFRFGFLLMGFCFASCSLSFLFCILLPFHSRPFACNHFIFYLVFMYIALDWKTEKMCDLCLILI